MTTFVELQCFNQLLLKKMERMEQKYNKLELEYESLREVTVCAGDCYINMEYIRYCEGCNEWFNADEEGQTADICCEGNCFKCDTCKHDVNTGIYECFKCESGICRSCNMFKCLDCCKECYLLEQYPDVNSEVFSNYDKCVNEFECN